MHSVALHFPVTYEACSTLRQLLPADGGSSLGFVPYFYLTFSLLCCLHQNHQALGEEGVVKTQGMTGPLWIFQHEAVTVGGCILTQLPEPSLPIKSQSDGNSGL